jgi:hypothetical protein
MSDSRRGQPASVTRTTKQRNPEWDARMGTVMDRLATGTVIALAAVLMSGSFAGDVMARETGTRAPEQANDIKSQDPVANGLRSERVLSLILTLEALRAAPALLEVKS